MKKSNLLFLLVAFAGLLSAQDRKPNVLFIAVDDLRPELGCYGEQQIKSPNIDKLASTGLTFNRSYCNIPVCGASRASIMSGIRPSAHRFLNYSCWQDKDVPGVVSLPMHFKNNGYTTLSMGKIYHQRTDGKGSWSETPWFAKGDWKGVQAYVSPVSLKQIVPGKNPKVLKISGPSFEWPDGPDQMYPDGKLADEAVRKLQSLKSSEAPFFLALGFRKPHLPFNAPKKYWDLYDFDGIVLPENMRKPENAPDQSMHNFGELRNYCDVPDEGPLEKEFMRKLIHGYYACVSYIDAQIGKVLNELENLGLADNTIVILWGDHGWQLGEHNLWCKHCNFEKVLRTPLILRVPGKKGDIKTDALVEYVDIYPSLCELAGLPKPFHLQGSSFVALTENPDQPWKEEVYCRYGKGETIVTQTHTYTEWLNGKTGETTARMLYNLKDDPEEILNISELKENESLVEEFSEKLKKHILKRDQLIIR